MQRYGDFGLIPRNKPDSCRSCCDKGMRLRQSRGGGVECVVSGKKRFQPQKTDRVFLAFL